MKDLSWEVTEGAKDLDTALADLQHSDAATQARLNKVNSELRAGSGFNPWSSARERPRQAGPLNQEDWCRP